MMAEVHTWEDGAAAASSDGYPGSAPEQRYVSPGHRSRPAIIVAVVVGVVLLCTMACCAAGTLLGLATWANSDVTDSDGPTPLDLVETDYPGWSQTTYEWGLYADSNVGSTHYYRIVLVPPERDFPVGVLYLAQGDGSFVVQDEVLRPDGALHERSDTLLDYLEENYVDKQIAVTVVTSDANGYARVGWIDPADAGFTEEEDTWQTKDVLKYDETDEEWYPVD